MDLSDVLSANLKKLRTERDLSLGQLAEISGVSKVLLSQIEKGESNPTINTLWKIAIGLKVPYTRLIDEQPDNAVLIRKAERKIQVEEGDAFRAYYYFAGNPKRDFEFFHTEMDPHAEKDSPGHAPNTQEFILVGKGVLTLRVNAQEYVLEEGDSIHFDCSLAHTYVNAQDAPLEFTDIIYYS